MGKELASVAKRRLNRAFRRETRWIVEGHHGLCYFYKVEGVRIMKRLARTVGVA